MVDMFVPKSIDSRYAEHQKTNAMMRETRRGRFWPAYGLTLVALCPPAYAAPAQSSHCTRAERTMFSCRLSESKKIVSLCASSNLSPSSGYMQYRFGHASGAELTYPAEKTPPKGKFEIFHTQFTRAGAYGISFRLNGFVYSLEYVASGPDEKTDTYNLSVVEVASGETKFSDACEKAQILGKTTFYPLEPLAKKLGTEIVEKTDEN
jgi:hypothetical protein